MDILKSIDKLDSILYESIINKYINCHNNMKKFIILINNKKIDIKFDENEDLIQNILEYSQDIDFLIDIIDKVQSN